MRYALRRLGFYLLAAWASLTLNFFLPRLMPGDPATAIFARFQGKIAPETLESMRAAMGLSDAPAIEQYIAYLGHVLRGDMGQSIAYGTDVMTVIGPALLWTMVIALTSLIIAFVLGTLLGIMAAWNRGGKLDTIGPPVLAFFGAFPYFWLAMLLLYLLGFGLDWFPVRHAYSDHLSPELSFTFVADVMAHAVLPVTSIVLATLGGWMLSMRNVMVSVLGDDYIRMARAKGLKPRRVMLRYAARNALLPNVTGFGMALGFVLGGSLLTEIVFSYPGMGYLLIQAVRNQDYPLMQGIFLMITFAVLIANWLVDLVYLWLDPRTR